MILSILEVSLNLVRVPKQVTDLAEGFLPHLARYACVKQLIIFVQRSPASSDL